MAIDLLEELKLERESGHSTYGEFLLEFKPDEEILYCFFEGAQDYSYYKVRIENAIHDYTFRDFCCSGKEAVLEVYQKIKNTEEVNSGKYGYFVDRDFDPLLNNRDIYETPFHSIENFYTTASTVEEIIHRVFRVPRASEDLQTCMIFYTTLFSLFHEHVKSINAWISCYVDKRHQGLIARPTQIHQKTRDLFTNCIVNDLSDINRDATLETFQGLQQLFDNNIDVTEEEFRDKCIFVENQNPYIFFRGKFEIQFLTRFLQRLKNKIENRHNGLLGRYPCRDNFETEYILRNLTMFAYTPPCLYEYIRNIAA